MSFTRFNYDDARTIKKLQESTGPGRYVMNTPGSGNNPLFIDDPHIRMQKWGANNRYVFNGSLIDIDNDLRNSKCVLKKYDTCQKKNISSYKITYPEKKNTFTEQSRATHPSWKYRDLEQSNKYPLFMNPQENVCFHFHNNLNTRLLERDNYKPCLPIINNLM
jgi:hypothetical protein